MHVYGNTQTRLCRYNMICKGILLQYYFEVGMRYYSRYFVVNGELNIIIVILIDVCILTQ